MNARIRSCRHFAVLIFLITAFSLDFVARAQTSPEPPIPLTDFMDSAHHWYDITDEEYVIVPRSGHPKHPASDIVQIADNILLFQKSNGGWPKNYDVQAVLTDDQKAALKKAKTADNTTFDNGATHSHVAYLAAAYTRTHDARYKDGCLKGIEFILRAQYGNGGWPQFYPESKGYARYITFNDGAMIGVMRVLHAIVRDDPDYRFIDASMKARVEKAFDRGIDCILRCQIHDNDTLTVWCQQHDEKTLLPQSARTFEPAAISNQESAEIVEFLMSIDQPGEAVRTSVESAVRWFTTSIIRGLRVAEVPAPSASFQYHTTTIDRVIKQDSTAPGIWPRYTEPATHRPLFSNRNWKKVYSLAEVDRERRTGYAWYTYAPQRVLDVYPAWHKKQVP